MEDFLQTRKRKSRITRNARIIFTEAFKILSIYISLSRKPGVTLIKAWKMHEHTALINFIEQNTFDSYHATLSTLEFLHSFPLLTSNFYILKEWMQTMDTNACDNFPRFDWIFLDKNTGVCRIFVPSGISKLCTWSGPYQNIGYRETHTSGDPDLCAKWVF